MKNGRNRGKPKSADGHSSDVRAAGVDFNPGPHAPGAAEPTLDCPAEAARRRRGGETMSAPPHVDSHQPGRGRPVSGRGAHGTRGRVRPSAGLRRLRRRTLGAARPLRPNRAAQDAAALPPLRSAQQAKPLRGRESPRQLLGLPQLRGHSRSPKAPGQGDGIGGRQCADKRKGRRRGGGRTVVRLNTEALWERLTTLNRSQNRLASEIGVGPAACRRRSTRGRRLRRPFQIGRWT